MENELKSAALVAVIALAGGCGNKTTPEKDQAPVGSTSAASASASAAAATAPPTTLPVLGVKPLEPASPKGAARDLYAIEGGIMVTEGKRVGHLVTSPSGDARTPPTIEWIGKIPDGSPALGDNLLHSIEGRWPDAVGALYQTSNGRAPQPTYQLLTGKPATRTLAEGGGFAWVSGVATMGESVVVAGWSSFEGTTLYSLRGPKVPRHSLTASESGCKPENHDGRPEPQALSPYRFGSTPAGTFMSIGPLCDKRGPAAEVWDASGKPRIVELRTWWKDVGFMTAFLRGQRDELWAYASGWDPILHYRDGAFEALPRLDKPFRDAFVSPRGELLVSDGEIIHRRDEGRWTAIAKLDKPVRGFAMDGDTIWAEEGPDIGPLREIGRAPQPSECSTPFVYLYAVASDNAKDFTFPSTRKALTAFPEASALRLVEFEEDGRRLGVVVTSKAQGEALVVHVNATMKDEMPSLHCFAPKSPRVIELEQPKGK